MSLQNAKAFDEGLCTALQTVIKHDTQPKISKAPYVTTMTVSVNLNRDSCDIEKLLDTYRECFQDDANSTVYQELRHFVNLVFKGSENFFPRKPKSTSTFHNCIVFSLCKLDPDDQSRVISVKCFTNCNLHITGVKEVSFAMQVAMSICMLYELVFKDTYNVTGYDIQLINAHFSFDLGTSYHFNLQKLYSIVIKETEHFCMYNNDRHAGVIVKLLMDSMKSVSVIIFESGNVLLCAFRNSHEFTVAWEFIINLVHKHWQQLQSNSHVAKTKGTSKGTSKSRKEFDYGKYLVLK
jgi:TATA-box binding protein (TBP) (component of TFIID and TFIIIB)